ncbi:MAG TPA: cytochrome ubiquinol oxidase subunit I [Solirubrobacteraceae bacterium]|jgi:hypothetical protein
MILAGLIFDTIVMLGICCWHLLRGRNVELFRRAAKPALIVAVPATLIQLSVGNRFGEAVTAQQGARPLLAIDVALLADAPVLILDEPTARTSIHRPRRSSSATYWRPPEVER